VALACNIDARGKVARLRIGIGLALIGLLLTLSWALPFGGLAAWVVSGTVLLAAAFSIFEGPRRLVRGPRAGLQDAYLSGANRRRANRCVRLPDSALAPCTTSRFGCAH
jgi:hypothetical protein